MALGGGKFLTQNKVLPGSYINFMSSSRATAELSDRGIAALALELDWGEDENVFPVDVAQVQRDSLKLFGYDYAHEKLRGIRDLFKKVKLAYLYRLNTGVHAENTFATARYTGVRGNDIKVVIATNVDDGVAFDVTTVFDGKVVDLQTVKSAITLIDNDFVIWKKDATLSVTAGTALAGGSNKVSVTGAEYQEFLGKIESYGFNSLGCLSTTAEITGLYDQFTRRMRDEVGAKFQTVVYRATADYEGIISVENKTTDADWPESSAVYWTTGVTAGCAVNKSNLNKKYDGEFAIDVDYKQLELEANLKLGKFMYHKVGDEIRVLDDINTFVSFTLEKGSDFASNQTMRVLDQIANDTALMFNTKYLGDVSNDSAGRISFWNDIVKHRQELQKIRAIEDFKADDVVVEKGESKKAVVVSDKVTPVNAMAQLYFTTIVQ